MGAPIHFTMVFPTTLAVTVAVELPGTPLSFKASLVTVRTGWMPVGGALGQALRKKSAANYDAEWADDSGGGAVIHRGSTAGNVSYCGTAAAGSAENTAVWTITRITVAAGGSVAVATASAVKWTDFLTASYS